MTKFRLRTPGSGQPYCEDAKQALTPITAPPRNFGDLETFRANLDIGDMFAESGKMATRDTRARLAALRYPNSNSKIFTFEAIAKSAIFRRALARRAKQNGSSET